jgi:hypothetical protein
VAATAIPACTPCYFGTDGSVNISTGAAANAAAFVDGWTMKDVSAGETCTLYDNVAIGYGPNVVAGKSYYLSGTNAGGLADAPSTGGTQVIARGIPDNSLTFSSVSKVPRLRVKKSY